MADIQGETWRNARTNSCEALRTDALELHQEGEAEAAETGDKHGEERGTDPPRACPTSTPQDVIACRFPVTVNEYIPLSV